MFENRHYVILSVSEIDKINFDELMQSGTDSLRKSIDQSKTLIKWDGDDTPNCVNDLTTKEGPFTYDEIISIMNSPDWTDIGPTL